MIYFITNQKNLWISDAYETITVQESLNIMKSWNVIQFDSETTGTDPHIAKLLCIQFGNKKADIQIVVDVSTINIQHYKDILENKPIIGQNLKFDLKFLFSNNIICMNVYDTMIVEQFLHLGYPSYGNVGGISFSLQAIAERYLNINIDKSIRNQIKYGWKGIDESVIIYAAGDVTFLEDIMHKQIDVLKEKEGLIGAKLECDFVPAISYLEWCGIKLDVNKWNEKIEKDLENLDKYKKELDKLVISLNNPMFYTINRQGDLFEGFNSSPVCTINWSSSQQVVNVFKYLGFDTVVPDKEKGKNKESVLEKHIKSQKGINDEFLSAYLKYQEFSKMCSTYGYAYISSINPVTNRIHTLYKQLGAKSGRMSCGSKRINEDVKSLNKWILGYLPKYPQLQNLPADELTRSSFVAEEGNLMGSADYNALESRLGADIYQEHSMLEEFLYGSGDMHSLNASKFFKKELENIPIKEIKTKRPDLRTKSKPIGFAIQFGGSEYAVKDSLGCTLEEARNYIKEYEIGYPGITQYKKEGSRKLKSTGYILICEHTGHKLYWHDYDKWKEKSASFTSGFWDNYREQKEEYYKKLEEYNKSPETIMEPAVPITMKEVSLHYQQSSKWDRMVLNVVTQGSGVIILKEATTQLFKWIVENNLFGKVLIVNLVHDEIVVEFPKEKEDIVSKVLIDCMTNAAAKFCKSLPIPASINIGNHWIH